jgi:lysophospholipase L1-like esterase
LFLVVLVTASPTAASPLRVLLIGDSITYGTGFVSDDAGPPYAELLASLLDADHEVVNAGCGGASSLDWSLSLPGSVCGGVGVLPDGLFVERALPHLPAEMVSIMLGTNDAIGFFEPRPVPVPIYRLALDEIVSNLLAAGADTVILMTPPDHIWPDPAARNRLIGYREQVLDICSETSSVICGPDVFALLDPVLHFEGGDLHPNARGHAIIAQSLYETIAAIPEPTTALLLAFGLAGLASRRRRPPAVSQSRPWPYWPCSATSGTRTRRPPSSPSASMNSHSMRTG